MGKQYAGILGSLAMVVTIARALGHGSEAYEAAAAGTIAMIVFAIIGFIVGQVASNIVTESVETEIAARIAAARNAEPSARSAK